jgi:hypothetical protein
MTGRQGSPSTSLGHHTGVASNHPPDPGLTAQKIIQADKAGGKFAPGARQHGEFHGGERSQLPKMFFPKFSGDHPRIWHDQCLDYFALYNISSAMWLTAATLHLEGNAAHWYQAYKKRHNVPDWDTFIVAVEAKFGAYDHRRAMNALLELKQKTTVEEYSQKFQELMFQISGHNPYYDETLFVSQFIKGLKHDIRIAVASQIPETVDRAIMLAMVQQELSTPLLRKFGATSQDTMRTKKLLLLGQTNQNLL